MIEDKDKFLEQCKEYIIVLLVDDLIHVDGLEAHGYLKAIENIKSY